MAVTEIAPDVFRISTYVPEIDMQFNQFLVRDDEPLLYHTGMRGLFPRVLEEVSRVIDPSGLRWVSFSHFESDECGALNDWLAVAPEAEPVCGFVGALVSVNDFAARPARPLADGEVLDIGGAALGRRVLEITTPHVPHNWESHMFYEQETGTLFCGDLLTQLGGGPALVGEDLVDAAIEAEDLFHQTSLGPLVPATYRKLADLAPKRLAIMHGSSYRGDGATQLRALAAGFAAAAAA